MWNFVRSKTFWVQFYNFATRRYHVQVIRNSANFLNFWKSVFVEENYALIVGLKVLFSE